MVWKIVGVAFAATLIASSAVANEANNGLSLSLNTNLQQAWVPKTVQALDYLSQKNAETKSSLSLYGAGVDASYRLSGNSFLSGTFLGNTPSIGISASKVHGSSANHRENVTTVANSAISIDGTAIGANWSAGTWTSKTMVSITEGTLTLKGAQDTTSWDIGPQFGLIARNNDQHYRLTRKLTSTGAYSQFLDGKLDSRMYGGMVGVEVTAPEMAGWNFGLSSDVTALYASTDMRVVQDPNSIFGATPDLTIEDNKGSAVYEAGLSFSVQKSFGAVVMASEVFGRASYGTPYIDATTSLGDVTKIATDDWSYNAGGKVSLTVNF